MTIVNFVIVDLVENSSSLVEIFVPFSGSNIASIPIQPLSSAI